MPAQTVIQVRRDTAANWTSTNPTLAAGEQGYETDTQKLKIGDGTTAWNSLGYFQGATNASNITTGTLSSSRLEVETRASARIQARSLFI